VKNEDVTAQIMEAWEEIDEAQAADDPEAAVTAPPAVDDPPEADEPETEEEEETETEESDDEPAEGDEPDEPEADEEIAAVAPAFEDVEIQAFLAKYGNDPEKALKGAAELARLMGRRDEEKLTLSRQVEELQAKLTQAQAFSGGEQYLSDEAREWVEAAAESPTPGVYVQQALAAGEYDLARAVCREWAQSNPFEAMRAGQFVDATQHQIQEAQSTPEPVPPAATWQALSQSYPELRTYEGQMVGTLERLGPEHPLVQEARSTDPAQAVRGILGIYEIAKAATFALSETRNGVKQKRRQEADDAIDAAAVTSASTSPSSGAETPRRRTLMPGLSEEDFEAAFAAPK
jgi:hypothetical protein